MEWSKLKNIIILMLSCVNAFLLVLVIQRQWESRQYAQSAREDAIAVLWETSRIHLDEALLPEEMDLPTLTVSRDQTLEQTQAAALLGEPLSLSEDGLRYEGPKGTAQFYVNGEFSADLLPGAYPCRWRPRGPPGKRWWWSGSSGRALPSLTARRCWSTGPGSSGSSAGM